MVKLVGRRTGVVVDTDDLAQDGSFDSIDAFWAAASEARWRALASGRSGKPFAPETWTMSGGS